VVGGHLTFNGVEACLRLAWMCSGSRPEAQRPVLQLALEGSPLLGRGVQTEIDFWTQLDRLRLKIYENSGREFAAAVQSDVRLAKASLAVQHAVRVEHAKASLSPRPILDYGVQRLIEDAQRATLVGLDPTLERWLPDARPSFQNLSTP
jgi:hypothetical protein